MASSSDLNQKIAEFRLSDEVNLAVFSVLLMSTNLSSTVRVLSMAMTVCVHATLHLRADRRQEMVVAYSESGNSALR